MPQWSLHSSQLAMRRRRRLRERRGRAGQLQRGRGRQVLRRVLLQVRQQQVRVSDLLVSLF
jgi:hypothetical protein